jgi:ribosomal protein L14
MLPKLARVKVIDASGAGWVQVFHIYRGFLHRQAALGDFIKGSIRRIAFYPKYRRGKRYRPLRLGYIVRGLVCQTRHPVRFCDGTRCVFFQNAIALLKRRGTLRSKYLVGPLSRTIRRRQYAALFPGYV